MFEFKRVWGPTPKIPNVLIYDRANSFKFTVLAGPCSIESYEQAFDIAKKVRSYGATHFRGGVFRAGTYPGKDFGYKWDLVKAHREASKAYNMQNIIEVLDYTVLPKLCEYADCLQVGSRGMQNYTLLKMVAETGKPIFLKRNQGATLDEWLGAAEHLLVNGCSELYLIERGSSTFENHVRWSLSISMIAAAKRLTNIPVIVDAAHGSGRNDLVRPLTLAGIAAGADGLLCEVHNDPENSLSDPEQAITPAEFDKLMKQVNKIREVIK
jgi:3-deoxy-7-phosphoheptulonate synthase